MRLLFFFIFVSSISLSQDLFDACRLGNVERLKALHAINPDTLNSVNENGFSPLIIATYKNQIKVVEFLLKNNASVNFDSPEGTALIGACYKGNFEIRSETICRKLIHKNGKVSSAILENLRTGKQEEIKAQIVIVTADALRTPQLLWASGIRPKALGHYLNEHPFVFTFVELKDDLVDKTMAKSYNQSKRKEPTIGVFWIPFDAPNHPFHGQIMHMDVSPLIIETNGNPKHIVGLGWGCLKESRFEDCIIFSETEKDYLGMPKMNFKFTLTEKDRAAIDKAMEIQAKAAAAFGKVIKEGEQTLMPAGTSLHYEGTIRMGAENDGESVCDTYSQVWGFDNLFVGGNGVIPIETTSNPTLTSVALAVRSAEKIVEILKY